MQSYKPSRSARPSNPKGIPAPAESPTRSNRFTSSHVVKEQPIYYSFQLSALSSQHCMFLLIADNG